MLFLVNESVSALLLRCIGYGLHMMRPHGGKGI